MHDFFSFTDLLPRALAKYKLDRQARATLICKRFTDLMPDVLGEDASGVVKAKYVKGGVLYVSVPSSIWAQKVYVHRRELLAKLRLEGEAQRGVDDLRAVLE
jgi:hypothetical protein